MISLTPDQARVLGVLLEKALTTPEQYPLTLNSAVNGCNQKSNRDPVTSLTEDAVFDAMQGLKQLGLVVQVDVPGARVPKYRQEMREKLQVNLREAVLIAEMMLRGPQTLGELRGRATRMTPFESMDMVRSVLESLAGRPEPLVAKVGKGGRAELWGQLLCQEINAGRENAQESREDTGEAAAEPAARTPGAADRLAALEAKVERLSAAITRLAAALGEKDPLGEP